MGDGSAIMQSAMLLSAAAGNGLHKGEGAQPVGASLTFQTADSSAVQLGDKAMGSCVNDTGWMVNGYNEHSFDPGRTRQHQQQRAEPLLQQQLHLPYNLQQQVQPTQALLDAQMAQLHGTFAQFRQQPSDHNNPAAGCSASTGPFGRLPTDGHWLESSAISQLKQQNPNQQSLQQCGAVSALRQGLLLLQQQQLVDKPPLGDVLQDGQMHQHPIAVSAPQALRAAAATSSAGHVSNAANSMKQGISTSSEQPAPANITTEPVTSTCHTSSRSRKPITSDQPSSNLTVRLSVQLEATYAKCAPAGSGNAQASGTGPPSLPRRVLTKPGAGVKNDGWDNESSDLVLCTQVSYCCCSVCCHV